MTVTDCVEDVLSDIGLGRWQMLIFLTAFLSQMVGPVQQLSSPLMSAPVSFRCFYPFDEQLNNLTINRLAFDHMVEYPSQCLSEMDLRSTRNAPETNTDSVVQLNTRATGLPSCPEVKYDTSTFQSTVITEWHLICENSALRPLYQMTYAIGAILGSMFCGQLSDRLGRKRTLQIGSIVTTATVLVTSIVPWYGAMITMKVLSGMGTILMVFPSYTIVSEVSPANRRTIGSMVIGLMYFIALSVFAGIGYLVPHWRKLLLLCNSPLILVIPLTFITDESPRWLLQKGRSAEAVDILKKAARQNGVIIKPSTSLMLDKLSQKTKDDIFGETRKETEGQGSLNMMRTCFSSPGMRIIIVVVSLTWFLLRALYVGIVINANNFTSSNPFEYVGFSGVMGVVAMIFTFPASVWLPRKVFLGWTFSMGGALMLLEMAVPEEYWWMKWIMVMTAFCLVCGAFQVNYAYGAELFPTVIRTRGFAFTNLIGSIGEMTAPLITDFVVQHHWWATSVTFGLAGIVGSLLLPFLPETMNMPMPQTLQDVEDRYHNSSGDVKDGTSSSPCEIREKRLLSV